MTPPIHVGLTQHPIKTGWGRGLSQYHEASTDPLWQIAMKKELNALSKKSYLGFSDSPP